MMENCIVYLLVGRYSMESLVSHSENNKRKDPEPGLEYIVF